MKIIQFWRLAPWFLCGILVGSGCTSRQSETVSLDAINQAIADSLKRHNISFVVQAINQGKREARDRDESKMFRRYKIKDIVFLAIITACTFITSVVMPFIKDVPVFGIIQICLGLQFSIFPVIGLMKIRKAGALVFQSLLMACFLAMMFPPMALIALCGLVAEGVALLIFRSYKNDWACVVAGTLYMPLTIPIMLFFGKVLYSFTDEYGQAMTIFLGTDNVWTILGITGAVLAICFVGSVLGMIISRELKKAGVLKK